MSLNKIIAISVLTLSAACYAESIIVRITPPKEVLEFVRYNESGNNDEGKIIGVILKQGVREYTDKDGKKCYYLAGKQLKALVEAYEEDQE